MRLITLIFLLLQGCFSGTSLAPDDWEFGRLPQSGESSERDIVIFADTPAITSRIARADGNGYDPLDGVAGSMAAAVARGDGDGDGSAGMVADDGGGSGGSPGGDGDAPISMCGVVEELSLTRTSTIAQGESAMGMANEQGSCGGAGANKEMAYRIISPGGVLALSLTCDGADMALYVRDSACDIELACETGASPSISLPTEIGEEYVIYVDQVMPTDCWFGLLVTT